MSLVSKIKALTAALDANTAAIRALQADLAGKGSIPPDAFAQAVTDIAKLRADLDELAVQIGDVSQLDATTPTGASTPTTTTSTSTGAIDVDTLPPVV